MLLTIHAARKLNLVAVPLSYRFNAEEMAYVIDNSDATVVVADAEYAPLIESVRSDLGKVNTSDRMSRRHPGDHQHHQGKHDENTRQRGDVDAAKQPR